MRGMGMQRLGWGWPAVAFGSACVLGAASLFVLRRRIGTVAGTEVGTGLTEHLAVLVAAVFTYLHWRLSGVPCQGG